jgi:protoporphyrinogen oxidase
MDKAPSVAVVGGGPGGLFATYILNQKFPNAKITLFEGSERLGGKLLTDKFSDGTPFEAGVAELYEYLGPGDKDPLRQLIEDDLALPTVDMKGGGVVLRGKLCRDVKEVEKEFSYETMKRIERFHRRMTELMPLEKYAHRWQPDNSHPWADKTFRECLCEEIPDDEIATEYVEAAAASDLATESYTCNGLNGIKNVLLDNDSYMQLYHVVGGIERISKELAKKIEAEVRTSTRVTEVSKNADDTYRVDWSDYEHRSFSDHDAVVVAIPNHWLTQLRWGEPKLKKAIQSILEHYDLPAHYLRVSLLFKNNWWEKHKIPGDFWMMDCFNGCCCYNESYRWRTTRGHVLSWLLGGQDALLQCSANQTDEEIIDCLVDSLPDWMRKDAEENLVEGQVDRYVGSINAMPGGWKAEELEGEHSPEPKGHPGLFLVGDYFFDSTLNAALISAHTAVKLLLKFFGVKGKKATKGIEDLAGKL